MSLNYLENLQLEAGNAICYSGFREGQQPGGTYPSYEQVKEDLLILQNNWRYLRLYDCDPHVDTVLKVIRNEKLPFKVMLGAYIVAEISNENCPWGGTYTDEELTKNRAYNLGRIEKLISIANEHEDIIFSLSVGNEACVDWTDHLVPIERVIEYVRLVKKGAKQPVTFCENYVPWLGKLAPLVEEVDFISIHTYPVWEYKTIDEALDYTQTNFYDVANKYPHKLVMITEAGWATNSNGRGVSAENVNEELQEIYYNQLVSWSNEKNIMTFVFEAFDESWKGSPDPLEPEKHWGLFKEDRTPKLVIEGFVSKRENQNSIH